MKRKPGILLFTFVFFAADSYAQKVDELYIQVLDLYSKGEYAKAIPIGEKTVEMAAIEYGESDSIFAFSSDILAKLYLLTGSYENAERQFETTIASYKRVFGAQHAYYAGGLNNLAVLYHNLGLYMKTEDLYMEILQIYEKTIGKESDYYLTTLGNLADLYTRTGKYNQAEPLFFQVIETYEKKSSTETVSYAFSLNNLSVLYSEMGNYEKAILYSMRAMEVRKKILSESHPDYVATLINLAGFYIRTGAFMKAENLLLVARDTIKSKLGENHAMYNNILNSLATLFQKKGQFSEAEGIFLTTLALRKKNWGDKSQLYSTALNNLALLYMDMKMYEKASVTYQEGLEIQKTLLGNDHPTYALGLSNLAFVYANMGNYDNAKWLLTKSLEIKIKNLKKTFTILSEKEKQLYLSQNEAVYQLLYSLEEEKPSENDMYSVFAFEQSLFRKSMVLSDTRKILSSLRLSQDTAIKTLFNKWLLARQALSRQYSLPLSRRIPDLSKQEEKTEMLEKELSLKSATFRLQQIELSVRVDDIRNGLQQHEAAIEFIRYIKYVKGTADSVMYAAYLLRKQDSQPRFLNLFNENKLIALLSKAGKPNRFSIPALYRGLIPESNAATEPHIGKELYDLIWKPLEKYLKGVKNIYYSPAGRLYQLAFGSLPADSNSSLQDKYALNQYINIGELALKFKEQETKTVGAIVLFGNPNFSMDSLELIRLSIPKEKKNHKASFQYVSIAITRGLPVWTELPGTENEVNQINWLFLQNKKISQVFLKTEASEGNIKELSGNSPQVLHIATHGFSLPEPDKTGKMKNLANENSYTLADDPLLRSGLILAGGNYAWSGKIPIEGTEDGIVTAYEISQLDLSKTELVVLSACETALGDVKGSEGVFGLQRALKMAGVKKMILSLWQVPDKETAELMTIFYGYWMKGKTINEAFAQAQADMRKKYPPYYWAAFVLVE